MLIPIGHEDQQVTRLPWVTILLVAANALIFLLTNQVVQQQAAETRQRVEEIVRYANEHPYLRVPAEMRGVVPSVPPRTDLDPEMVAQEQTRLDAMWDFWRSRYLRTLCFSSLIKTSPAKSSSYFSHNESPSPGIRMRSACTFRNGTLMLGTEAVSSSILRLRC